MGRIRGQWFNATSNLFAFCSLAEEKEEKVHHFQQYLVRLVSLLHCAALQQVADMEEEVRTSIRCLSHVSSDLRVLSFSPLASDLMKTMLSSHPVL